MEQIAPNENLYMQGLPLEMTDEMLKAIFMQYGTVMSVRMLDPIPGKADRVALLQMGTVDQAQWIVSNINQNIPNGLATPVTVQFSKSTPPASGAAPQAVPAPTMQAMGLMGGAMPSFIGGGMLGALPGATAMASLTQTALPASVSPQAAGVTSTTVPLGVPLKGSVKRWDTAKGFGFIVPDGGGPDVFVHAKELGEGFVLTNGSQVVFEAMLDPSKGPGRFRAKTIAGGIAKEVAIATGASTTDRLFVTGLPIEVSEEQITNIFNQYGQAQSVKKLPTQPGKTDAAALVKMADPGQAKWLVENVHQNIPSGLTTPVNIAYAENKSGKLAAANPFAVPGAIPQFGKAPAMPSAMPGMNLGPYGAATDPLAAYAALYGQMQMQQMQQPLMGFPQQPQLTQAQLTPIAGFAPNGLL